MKSISLVTLFGAVFTMGACGGGPEPEPREAAAAPTGEFTVVEARVVPSLLEASGTAEPYAESTLSTKLMGTVLSVRVREGERVRRGDVLLELDARDLDAKAVQVNASLSEAQAVLREAKLHADRMRRLYSEEAAPKARLDEAETSLDRARAAVDAANASAAELKAVRDYAVVRAPFDGTVVRRMVDPGAFAAPGAPLIVVQDARRLRLVVTAPPDAVRGIAKGDELLAAIEGVPARATVEGIVPAAASLYTINAIVDNGAADFLAGSAATLSLPVGERDALIVPAAAIHRQGDLTGVWIGDTKEAALRWVRLGRSDGDSIEVLAGLRSGDRILVPTAAAGAE